MIKKLRIQNYAIIDELEIDFSGRLNIITGETGAGKSILVGALGLILGERADTSVLLDVHKKCFVEGYFSFEEKKNVEVFLQENDLYSDDNELVLRREIAVNGKSRAFINDTPAALQQLRVLASLLVDLHQQFDSLELGQSGFQRDVLDALANNSTRLNDYQINWRNWVQAKKEYEEMLYQKNQFNREFDYYQFLFNELKNASFSENELEDLENELKMLTNSENIKTALTQVYFELKENEQPVVNILKQLSNQLSLYASYYPGLGNIIDRLRSAQIELQDIAGDADSLNNGVNYDAQRIEWINERLSEGYKLLKKHGAKTTNELLAVQASLEEKLKAVLHIDEVITVKEKEAALLYEQVCKIAEEISVARKKQAVPFAEKVNVLLIQVGMPNAILKVNIKETVLNNSGKDDIEFLFDANKSNRFELLRKVASGGELSRLMLCIKSLVAESIDLPTLIFDEIDSGISGEAAKQVGVIMKELSSKRQVICITHQPQIAGKADAHFFVYKEIKNDTIKTSIRLLSGDERITIIAQMLSGEKPTAAAQQNAREMVMN